MHITRENLNTLPFPTAHVKFAMSKEGTFARNVLQQLVRRTLLLTQVKELIMRQ